MNIEEVAATNPTAIMYEPIDINKGITKEQAERIVTKLGLDNVKDYISNIIINLYKMFLKKDALLLEVNPLAEDINGNCKFTFLSPFSFCKYSICAKSLHNFFFFLQISLWIANADLMTTPSSDKRSSSV